MLGWGELFGMSKEVRVVGGLEWIVRNRYRCSFGYLYGGGERVVDMIIFDF